MRMREYSPWVTSFLLWPESQTSFPIRSWRAPAAPARKQNRHARDPRGSPRLVVEGEDQTNRYHHRNDRQDVQFHADRHETARLAYIGWKVQLNKTHAPKNGSWLQQNGCPCGGTLCLKKKKAGTRPMRRVPAHCKAARENVPKVKVSHHKVRVLRIGRARCGRGLMYHGARVRYEACVIAVACRNWDSARRSGSGRTCPLGCRLSDEDDFVYP